MQGKMNNAQSHEEEYLDDGFDDDNYDDENQQQQIQKNPSQQRLSGQMQNFNPSGQPSGAGVVGNGQIQNDLVDKEVEQVIMKSSSNKGPSQKLGGGGYALPGDEDDEDDGALIGQVNLDDHDQQDKAQDSDEEDAELDQEDEEELDGEELEEVNQEDEDIDQQIVNIQSKNGRENLQQQQQINNDAILVINNQNNIDSKDRPQTKQVKHRQQANNQAQQQRPRPQQQQVQQNQNYGAQLPQGLNQQQYYEVQQNNFVGEDSQQEQFQQQQQYPQGMVTQQAFQQQPQQQMAMPQQRQLYSQGGMRRNLINQFLNNNNTQQGNTPGYSMLQGGKGDGIPGHLDQFKRKKLREMIFGVKQQPQTQSFNYFVKMQKEDLQNHYRNLKITNNITKDENTRLKTKLQQIQAELNQRDKELEKLTIRLQQTFAQPNTSAEVNPVISTKAASHLNHHFAESFIVSQLKKNNRDLKLEVQEKDRLIEQLKRNIKMSKSNEIEIELTVYIEECLRLRTQLEQVLVEKTAIEQQQEMNMAGNLPGGPIQQRNQEEISNLEEAFKYQEMQLEKERENSNGLQMQLMKLQEQKGKLKEKSDANKKRLKKINELSTQNKRQATLLEVKTKESQNLRNEMGVLQSKYLVREKVNRQNQDLVTKSCGLSSKIERLEKVNQEFKDQVNQLTQEKQQLSRQAQQASQNVGFQRPPSIVQQQAKKASKSPVRAALPPSNPVEPASVPKKSPAMKQSPPKKVASVKEIKSTEKAPSPETKGSPPAQPKKSPSKAHSSQKPDTNAAVVGGEQIEADAQEAAALSSQQYAEDDQVQQEDSTYDQAFDDVNEGEPAKKLSGKGLSASPAKNDLSNDNLKTAQQIQKEMEAAEQEINDMIDEVWAKYDVDKNGYLDKIETKKFVLDTLSKFEARTQFSDEMFEEVFKMFDKNNSGTVEKAEMATFIKQLAGIDMDDNYEDDENGGQAYQIEKSQEEIQNQGYLTNFFECPYEYQKVIFMMVKGDQDGLGQSSIYSENIEMFNYYLGCIIEFSQQFDPTETLMIIANDSDRREFIHSAPEEEVPLSFIINDLWPKLGFLPIDPKNPGVALIAEFMLNELILKNSESLDKLDLTHLKELFSSGEGEMDDMEMGDDEDYENDMDMEALTMEEYKQLQLQEEMRQQSQGENSERPVRAQAEMDDDQEDETQSPRVNQANSIQKVKSPPKDKQQSSDNYSSDEDDDRFGMDINKLKKQEEKEAKAKGKAVKDDVGSEEDYDDDEF